MLPAAESTIDSTRLVPGPINKIHNHRHCDAKGQQKSKRTWLCHDSAGIPTRVRRSVVDGKRLTLLNRVIRYAIVRSRYVAFANESLFLLKTLSMMTLSDIVSQI
jgi:hypothetical protein